MKLHRNAALSLKKRELLCDRVVAERWSLTTTRPPGEGGSRAAANGIRVAAVMTDNGSVTSRPSPA